MNSVHSTFGIPFKKVEERIKYGEPRTLTMHMCYAEINGLLLHSFLQRDLEKHIVRTWNNALCSNFAPSMTKTMAITYNNCIAAIRKYFENIIITDFDIARMAEYFTEAYNTKNKVEMSPITFIQYLKTYMWQGAKFCKIIFEQADSYLAKMPELTSEQIRTIREQNAILRALQTTTSLLQVQQDMKRKNDLHRRNKTCHNMKNHFSNTLISLANQSTTQTQQVINNVNLQITNNNILVNSNNLQTHHFNIIANNNNKQTNILELQDCNISLGKVTESQKSNLNREKITMDNQNKENDSNIILIDDFNNNSGETEKDKCLDKFLEEARKAQSAYFDNIKDIDSNTSNKENTNNNIPENPSSSATHVSKKRKIQHISTKEPAKNNDKVVVQNSTSDTNNNEVSLKIIENGLEISNRTSENNENEENEPDTNILGEILAEKKSSATARLYNCVCGKVAASMCICKKVFYCSSNCQSNDWDNHEPICTYNGDT